MVLWRLRRKKAGLVSFGLKVVLVERFLRFVWVYDVNVIIQKVAWPSGLRRYV